jgi:hypothetical protein
MRWPGFQQYRPLKAHRVYNTVIYAFKEDEYVVIFTSVSGNEEEKKQLEEIMGTLSFK